MKLTLAHGRGFTSAELPEGAAVDVYRAPLGPGQVDEADVVERALDDPRGEVSLVRAARGARRVSILISGKDRVAGASTYLPVLLDRLSDAGVPRDGVEIVCATGTHARHSKEDVVALVGEEVAGRVRFRAQDCDEAGRFVDLGVTSRGTPVLLDRGVVEADLRILTGRIAHHYFAGFSGGRKSILPGVAARRTIVANHRLVLDFTHGVRVHPDVAGGVLDGNPVHEDMLEAARAVGPTFVLNTALDRRRRITRAFAGELDLAHRAGCLHVDETCRFEIAHPADAVIASAGGHPADVNLIQAVKALFNHQDAVRPGGVFVLVAEAAGGVLRGMREWMALADGAELHRAMEARYDLAAHNTLMLRETLARMRVVLVSALPEAEVRPLGLVPAASLAAAVASLAGRDGTRPSSIRVIESGNVTQSGPARGRILEAPGAKEEKREHSRVS